MSILHSLSGGVEITRTGIIAESLPGVQDVVFRRGCECGEVGESAEPLIIIRDNGSDLRLLKHELGDEDCVRIACAPPGKIPATAAIPTEKQAAESADVL